MQPQRCFTSLNIFRLGVLFLFAFSFVQPTAAQTNPKSGAGEVVRLELNKPLERRLETGAAQIFQVGLNANQRATIIVEQPEFDATVQLFAASGETVARSNDEIRLKRDETIEIVAGETGDYRIEIRAMSKSGAGVYQIRFAETRPATALDRAFTEAHALVWRADALNEANKTGDALPLAERALAIAERELGAKHWLVGRSLSELGNIQLQTGKYAAAQILLERAVAASEESLGADHPQTLLCRQNLAANHNAAGDYAKAERLYRQTVADYERTLGADNFRVGGALVSFGRLLNFLGDSAQAEIQLRRALPILEKHFGAEHGQVANLLKQIGTIYLDKRENDRAAEYLHKALAIYEKTSGAESLDYGNTLLSVGVLHRRRREFQKALEIYRRVLSITEKNSGGEHPNVAVILNNIANIEYENGDIQKALETQRRARGVAERSVGLYHGNTLLSIENSARYYTVLGDVPNAIAYRKLWDERYEKVLALNLTIGSERQKLAYMTNLETMTARTIDLHLVQSPGNQTAVDAAALVVLQRKGRILDAVADNVAALRRRSGRDDLDLLDRLSETTAQLAKLTLAKPAKMSADEHQKQTAELENQKETLEREINNRRAELAAQLPPTVTLEVIRAQIPPDAALVEFAVYLPYNPRAGTGVRAVGEPHYIAYAVRRDGAIRSQSLGDAKTINQMIAEWRKALRDPASANEIALARRTDEKIMRPVRALLGAGVNRLLVAPDDDLNLIPFEALADERNRRLIENFSFTYLSSGRDLLRLQTRRTNGGESLVVADPQFGASEQEQTAAAARQTGNAKRRSVTTARNLSETYFAPLGGTIREARRINALFPDARILTGANASEAALKRASAPPILHIATHGFFLTGDDRTEAATAEKDAAPVNPLLRSGLALAGANRREAGQSDDGILTALEASGLNLWGTKLVVLSACDTGLGEVKTSEGVYGLRRAFTLAGAESIVMSLWSVSDAATRELMTDYYKNLKAGVGRGAALRAAQLDMLKRRERQHPFYWAAFIQSGEWANLDGKR